MKISELARRTGTSKKTIHYYIKEGLLRKPRRSKENTANYTETHVETLRLINELRTHYYLPLPEIKKALKQFKKLPKSDVHSIRMQNQYLKPLDRLFPQEIAGRKQLCEKTGLGRKWLERFERWGVITPKWAEDQPIYTSDNVILGKLIVELDRLGFGPKDGQDPKTLKRTADFIREVLLGQQQADLEAVFGGGPITGEQLIVGRQYEEVMSLFIYFLFRKIHREGFEKYLGTIETRQDKNPQEASLDK